MFSPGPRSGTIFPGKTQLGKFRWWKPNNPYNDNVSGRFFIDRLTDF